MNLLLFSHTELRSKEKLVISGKRATHIIEVLRAEVGQKVKAGEINGRIGEATILAIQQDTVHISWLETQAPPPPLPCILVLALPRPKMLSRVLQTVASMGVKEAHLINSWKVDKSYWKSPRLSDEKIRSELLTGLEQAIDTTLPEVYLHRLFKPFAEDVLPELCANRTALIAHPYTKTHCPINIQTPSILSVGPEGGFTDYETELLEQAGMSKVHIGARILRVETAVPVLLSRLHPAA